MDSRIQRHEREQLKAEVVHLRAEVEKLTKELIGTRLRLHNALQAHSADLTEMAAIAGVNLHEVTDDGS